MTSKERMLIAMKNGRADRVPVAPDMSNMIPCRLTGKPFWDIYLYKNPPLWKAYIDAVRYFGFDGWLTDDADIHTAFDEKTADNVNGDTVIVFRDEQRLITRKYSWRAGERQWSKLVTAYERDNAPTLTLASKLGLGETSDAFEPIVGVKEQKTGAALLNDAMDYMGDDGVVGVYIQPPHLGRPEIDAYSIYDYMDRPDEVRQWARELHERSLRKLERVLSLKRRPDFILTGGSGMLIFNTPDILRELALPTLKEVTRICKQADIPTQIHCCGPSLELVKMCAEETDLSNINPLEIRPMGDCDLAEVKRLYGHHLSLMGNLHTTEIMLRGQPAEVEQASRQAIDDAAHGGGFILSTGDQCGRDTPFANIRAMIAVAKTYGTYD